MDHAELTSILDEFWVVRKVSERHACFLLEGLDVDLTLAGATRVGGAQRGMDIGRRCAVWQGIVSAYLSASRPLMLPNASCASLSQSALQASEACTSIDAPAGAWRVRTQG